MGNQGEGGSHMGKMARGMVQGQSWPRGKKGQIQLSTDNVHTSPQDPDVGPDQYGEKNRKKNEQWKYPHSRIFLGHEKE